MVKCNGIRSQLPKDSQYYCNADMIWVAVTDTWYCPNCEWVQYLSPSQKRFDI